MNVLVLHDYAYDADCFLIERSLKSLSAAGYRAFVISADDPRYQGLRLSRNYTKWMTCDLKTLDVATINAYCRRRSIDLVMPSDIGTTFMLARMGDAITAAHLFPLASPESLALLHNKWSFMQWLGEHGLPFPTSQLLAPDAALGGFDFGFPLIAKPLESSGGRGVQKIDSLDELRVYMRDHRVHSAAPFLIQTFVSGEDLVFGVLADHGRIVASTMQKYCADGSRAEFIQHPELLRMGEKIVSKLHFHGVAEFDVRLDAADRPWFIECNPRLWASIVISMCMGVNYVDLGIKLAQGHHLPDAQLPTGSYVWPKQAALKLLRRQIKPTGLSRQSLYGMFVDFSDPLPLIYDALKSSLRGARRPVSSYP